MRIWKPFFFVQKTGLIMEYPNRFKAIRIFHDCKEPNLSKFTTCEGIQLSSPPVLWAYESILNKENSPEMKRSQRVDNPSVQEKFKTDFLRKIKANLKTGFIYTKKNGLIMEYPNRFNQLQLLLCYAVSCLYRY